MTKAEINRKRTKAMNELMDEYRANRDMSMSLDVSTQTSIVYELLKKSYSRGIKDYLAEKDAVIMNRIRPDGRR